MRVIPVLDLQAGRAVLARRGLRATYRPVASALAPGAHAGDALALARAFRERLGCEECYVADLDAIAGAPPQRPLIRSLARSGLALLLDGGAVVPGRARQAVANGVARMVVGLETLASFDVLGAIAAAIGGERLVFSLDLRGGAPVVAAEASHRGTPLELARAAAAAGVGALLVLDLARVGSGSGPDLALVAELRRAHRGLELLVGGGVGSRGDLERLADAGCDGALVATALHDGRLGRADLDAIRGLPHGNDSR